MNINALCICGNLCHSHIAVQRNNNERSNHVLVSGSAYLFLTVTHIATYSVREHYSRSHVVSLTASVSMPCMLTASHTYPRESHERLNYYEY